MKNVESCLLRKCIIFDFAEFKEIFDGLFENDCEVGVEYSVEGIYFCGITNEEVYDRLSEEFGVLVTSVHSDNAGVVWICYKDIEEV